MTDDQKRETLINKISNRCSKADKWGSHDFVLAQTFLWLAILASFLTAILAAADAVPALFLSFLTAIPALAIMIDKHFAFAKRARWNWEVRAGLDDFINRLQFSTASVEEIVKELGVFIKEMEAKFPGMSFEGLGENFRK